MDLYLTDKLSVVHDYRSLCLEVYSHQSPVANIDHVLNDVRCDVIGGDSSDVTGYICLVRRVIG